MNKLQKVVSKLRIAFKGKASRNWAIGEVLEPLLYRADLEPYLLHQILPESVVHFPNEIFLEELKLVNPR